MPGQDVVDGRFDGVAGLPAARSLPEWFGHAPCPYQLRLTDGLQVLTMQANARCTLCCAVPAIQWLALLYVNRRVGLLSCPLSDPHAGQSELQAQQRLMRILSIDRLEDAPIVFVSFPPFILGVGLQAGAVALPAPSDIRTMTHLGAVQRPTPMAARQQHSRTSIGSMWQRSGGVADARVIQLVHGTQRGELTWQVIEVSGEREAACQHLPRSSKVPRPQRQRPEARQGLHQQRMTALILCRAIGDSEEPLNIELDWQCRPGQASSQGGTTTELTPSPGHLSKQPSGC